jgi:hypothetical protein
VDDLQFAQGADGFAGLRGEGGGGVDPFAFAAELAVLRGVDGGDLGFQAAEEIGGGAVGDEDFFDGAGGADEDLRAGEQLGIHLQVGGAHLKGDVGLFKGIEDAGDAREVAHGFAQGVCVVLAIAGGAEHGGVAVALEAKGLFDAGDAELEFGDQAGGEVVFDGVREGDLDGAHEHGVSAADVVVHNGVIFADHTGDPLVYVPRGGGFFQRGEVFFGGGRWCTAVKLSEDRDV